MHSKKTAELRKLKSVVRAKLMAAVAMLLVSTITLSSTTYAWFVLSTAPEVKGMTTTVGSNGSLEMALLNNETALDTSKIPAGVGDSSAKQDVNKANESWGNIVDLNTGYGLNTIKLYPSALNLNAEKTQVVSLSNPLAVPVYGTDGRVAELTGSGVVSGKFAQSWFASNAQDFGVRAIGTAAEIDPMANALGDARSNFRLAMNAANQQASQALAGEKNANAIAVTKILIGEKVEEYNDGTLTVKIEVTEADIAAMGNMITGMQTAVAGARAALAYYVVGYEATQNNVVDFNAVRDNLDKYTYIEDYVTELVALEKALTKVKSDYDAQVEADEPVFSGVLAQLIDSSKVTIKGQLLSTFKTQTEALKLLNSPNIEVNGGVLSDVANFVNTFATTNSYNVDLGGDLEIEQATIKVNTNYTDPANTNPSGAHIPAYLPAMKAEMDEMKTEGGATGEVAIATEYGYAIDLAFRTSTAGNLRLSEAQKRVSTDTEGATQGAGSTFTLNGTETNGLMGLRVVFIKNDAKNGYEILGVAGIDVDSANNGTYALNMHEWNIGEGGALVLGAVKADDVITALPANTVTTITALVYLDGNYVSSTLNETQGTLNLQFDSSADLEPMDYTGYVSSVGGEG